MKFLELTCGFLPVPPATLTLRLGSGGDPSNRSAPRCTLTYTLTCSCACTPAHLHSLTLMHGHTPLTRAHAHSHWCAAPCTLARTHVHAHPFAHWHALTRTHTHSHTDARPSQPPWPSGVEGRGGFPLASTPVAAHSLVHSLTAVPRSPLREGRRHVTPSLIHLFPGHPARCLAGAGPPRVPASEVERGRAQGPAWGGEGHVEGGLSGGGAALRDGVLGTPSPAAPRPRQAALLRPDSAAPTGRDSAPPSHKRPCR